MSELTDADWLRSVAVALDADKGPGPDWSERLRMIADEMDNMDRVGERMDDLLTRTANALKGEPPPLTLHDWSDLPEVAARVVAERANGGPLPPAEPMPQEH
jgi:hypothetical protein